jgi:hypothetical protein
MGLQRARLLLLFVAAGFCLFLIRYHADFSYRLADSKATSTSGAISVHINSNEHTDNDKDENWIDFDAQWCV